jgi:transposase-like protein
VDGVADSPEKVIGKRLSKGEKVRLTSPSAVLMLDGRRFELVNPVCPECGSSKVIKQEFRKRNPKLADFGELEIYVRRYKCHHCGRKFTTSIEGVVKPNDQYARLVKEYVNTSIAKGYSSLSELRFQVFANYGLLPSRQSVWNWIANEADIELEPSGYYCYDEEYLKIDGERRYRLTLFDHITNVVVDEAITKSLKAEEIEGFLRTVLEGKPLVAITTDGRMDYKGIVEGLGAIHQLCVFHLVQNLLEDLYYYHLRKERIDPIERMAAARLATEFQNVFRSSSYSEAEERFERLLDSYKEMPTCLRKYVDKVMMDFDRYTVFLKDPMISKTSNPVEGYFRQTSPEKVKRIYKSPHGLMKFLRKRAAFWSIKHGLLSPGISRFIGLKLLGRRFADRKIEMLFSDRKKHFLSYWATQPPMI